MTIRRALETPIMFAIRAALAPLAMVHRNNTGFDADAKVRYGLGKGGPDLVAIPSGRFFGCEVKAPKGRLSPEQAMWHAAARDNEAFITVCNNPDDAVAALERARLCRCIACGHVGAPHWEYFE